VFREFNKEAVMAAHEQFLRQRETTADTWRRPEKARNSIRDKEEKIEKVERVLPFVTLFVLVGAIFLWGYEQSRKKPNLPDDGLTTTTMEQSQRAAPAIDYLEPI
jgi:hypothetical protein